MLAIMEKQHFLPHKSELLHMEGCIADRHTNYELTNDTEKLNGISTEEITSKQATGMWQPKHAGS